MGVEEMTKEQIYEMVCAWIDSGKLVQKSSIIENGKWYEVWRAVGRGEMFFTSYERVIATDKDTRDCFQELVNTGRIATTTAVTIHHPECTSAHAVNKLVEQGVLLKISKFSSITLYIE